VSQHPGVLAPASISAESRTWESSRAPALPGQDQGQRGALQRLPASQLPRAAVDPVAPGRHSDLPGSIPQHNSRSLCSFQRRLMAFGLLSFGSILWKASISNPCPELATIGDARCRRGSQQNQCGCLGASRDGGRTVLRPDDLRQNLRSAAVSPAQAVSSHVSSECKNGAVYSEHCAQLLLCPHLEESVDGSLS